MTSTPPAPSPAPPAGGFSLISNEKLLALHASMLRCRLLLERCATLAREADLALNEAAAPGREAALVGVTANLRPSDTIFALPHDPAVQFLQGASLPAILHGLLARPEPGDRDAASAAALKSALHAALASIAEGNGAIAVVFLGLGSAFDPPAAWRPTLQVAAAHRLPILFVCLAGPAADPLPSRNRQARNEEIVREAHTLRLPRIVVDGNDVVAVYRVTTEAITQARKGYGATIIECASSLGEQDAPLRTMERYLTRKGLFQPDAARDASESFIADLDAAHPSAATR